MGKAVLDVSKAAELKKGYAARLRVFETFLSKGVVCKLQMPSEHPLPHRKRYFLFSLLLLVFLPTCISIMYKGKFAVFDGFFPLIVAAARLRVVF